MAKAHILIRSVALSVLLMISSPAQANGPVDQVLVQYFKKLYGDASPKCAVDPAFQTKILSEIEPKCLIRDESKAFIAGVKPNCSEESIRNSVNAQVNAHCGSTAFKLDQEKQVVLQKQQAAEQEKQKAAAAKKAAAGNNPNSPSSSWAQAAQGLQLYSQIAPRELRKKVADTVTGKEDAAKEVAAKEAAAKEAAAKPTTAATPSKPSNPTPPTATAPQAQPVAMTKEQQAKAAQAQTDMEVAKKEYDVCMDESTKVGSGDTCSGPKMQMDDAEKRLQSAAPNGLPSKDAVVTQASDIANKQTGDLKKPSADTVDGKAPEGEDAELKARHEKSRAEDTNLQTQIDGVATNIKTATGRMPGEATPICTTSMGTNPDCAKTQPVITCLDTNMAELQKLKTKLQTDKESCSNSSAQAEKLCSLVRSDKAKDVQKLMSVGATILSKVTAASEACGTTSDISKIAQGGMLLAQGSCTAMKFRCDFSCNSAKKTLIAMEKTVTTLKACGAATLTTVPSAGPQVDTALTQLGTKLKEELGEQKSVPLAITQCQNHKADIALMGLSALGFGSAFLDAENCKEQLAAGESNNSGKSTSSLAGAQMTTAEYCSAPANATSLTCKCTNNPNADGCMGSIAKSGVNVGKINSGEGVSAFASANQNGLGSVQSLSKSPSVSDELAPGANLSDAAREALGIGGNTAAGDSNAASANAGSSPEGKKTKDKEEEKEKPKYGFFSSLSNMMSGGRAPSAAANAAIRKFEQEQAIKRKLASDQVRAEVTAASGKSNFDKIRSRYQQNAASFEQ